MSTKKPFSIINTKFLETLATGLLLGMFVIIVLQQSNPYLTKLGRDAGIFAYVGSQIIDGHQLYISVWDNKPPGIFLINALGIWLGNGTRWGIFVLEFVLFSALL